MQFEKMLKAKEQAELARRYEQAYWTAWMVNVHLKKKIKVEQLVHPFVPKKTTAQKVSERDRFFEEFKRKRKEEADGNRSGSGGKNRS